VIAVDTNVIVRLVTADDPGQLETARALFQGGDLWICRTVLLETEWVLRYSYELNRTVIQEIFRKLLGYSGLQMEARDAVLRALVLYDRGMDFADALHLVSSGEADLFATFDRPFAKLAQDLESEPQVMLLKAGTA
jgi:predicted nucleic-acid-binding protein